MLFMLLVWFMLTAWRRESQKDRETKTDREIYRDIGRDKVRDIQSRETDRHRYIQRDRDTNHIGA